MQRDELNGKYQNLRTELDAAYAEPIWDSNRINRIATEMIPVEFALASLEFRKSPAKVCSSHRSSLGAMPGIGSFPKIPGTRRRSQECRLPCSLQDAEGGEVGFPRARVLTVDDDRDTADTTADLLRLDGHDVKAVYGGEEAVDVARTFPPHIVMLDINMPEVNGYRVAASRESRKPRSITSSSSLTAPGLI